MKKPDADERNGKRIESKKTANLKKEKDCQH